METKHVLIGIVVILVAISGFQAYSMMSLTKKISTSTLVAKTVAPVQASNVKSIQLPANIQSSAPMSFSNIEEEIAYYKKNAKNPNNLNIERAVRNMDANLDGVCDKCGMAILHCIESGMEDM